MILLLYFIHFIKKPKYLVNGKETNPKCAIRNNSCLLFTSAEMFKKSYGNSVDPDRSSLIWVHAVCFYT